MTDLPFYYARCDGFVRRGRVTSVSATSLSVSMPGLSHAGIVSIQRSDGGTTYAQVYRADQSSALCTPLDSTRGIVVGAPAVATQSELGAYVGASLLGEVVDAWGRGPRARQTHVAARHRDIRLEERRPVTRALTSGITAIDAFCTIGAGQRIALFAGAGVGKSTLLRQMAAHMSYDVHVLALIGERAREASESIEAFHNSARWHSTTVVCATAAATPMERFAAVRTAQAQADWLCAQGCHVLLTVDSLTRVANAWRELALAAGEAPAHRGHPASLVSILAGVVENAGAREQGSITGIYTVLVDGDDPYEPVSDSVRGLLDGHVMLARRLADAGRFPAIDVLRSSSRLMTNLTTREHAQDAALLRRALTTIEDSSDLIAIGAYRRGGDAWLDAVLELREDIESWLYHGLAGNRVARDGLALLARELRSAHGRCAAGA